MTVAISHSPELPLMDAANTSPDLAEQEEHQEAMAALSQYFGEEVIILAYDALIRKDYTGSASHKVQRGGALIIRCMVIAEEGAAHPEIVIDDANRPLPEKVIIYLGRRAEANWAKGRGITRDYPLALNHSPKHY